MCRPIRTLTEAKGHDTGLHNFASFGGAGGQHACDVAKALGISRVLIHRYSSVLSAYGMSLADLVHEERSPSAVVYGTQSMPALEIELDKLQAKAVECLQRQGIQKNRVSSERFLNMRFQGSDTPLMTKQSSGGNYFDSFREAHMKQFGFLPASRDIIIDDCRVRSVGHSIVDLPSPWPVELASFKEFTSPKTSLAKDVYFKDLGWCQTPIYALEHLVSGSKISGPAMIMDDKQTIMVIPQSTATILSNMVIIDVEVETKATISAETVDPIQLSIFGHRFMGVAEQMGRALQKTSVSTNIKERLDFSCTVFSPDGGLVANAPHVPAMVRALSCL